MEIRDLQYFCMTAELEHVTKAADKLDTKIAQELHWLLMWLC